MGAIKEAYSIVKEEYDEFVKEELRNDYKQAIGGGEENIFRENLTKKGHHPEAMEFDTLPNRQRKFTKFSKICPKEATGQSQPSKVPCLVIKKEKTVLQMNHWIKISRNIVTEDREQATHVPFFEEEQDDVEVDTMLKETCSGGVHGMKSNWESSAMNDWLLYSVMRRTLQKFDFRQHPDLFYSSINKLWPNKWTQAKLSQGFPSLCAVFAEDGYDVKKAEPWKPEPEQHAKRPRCSNIPFTPKPAKKVYVAESKIAGYGLFIDESARKHEFIMEYTGERITEDETERRGQIYNMQKCSYLYNLTTGGAIDATKVGNESRFANNSDKPNLYPKWLPIGGEERIAFFASEKLERHTELTVNYGYSQEHEKIFFGQTVPKQGETSGDR